MKADKSPKYMVFTVWTWLILPFYKLSLVLHIDPHFFPADECQSKYGSANVWKYCCSVFDYLTLAAVSNLITHI